MLRLICLVCSVALASAITTDDPVPISSTDDSDYVDSKRDGEGLIHVEDVNMKKYTKDTPAFIYHFEDKSDTETLEIVKSMLQPLSTIEFQLNATQGFWIDFGVTHTSRDLQKQLKLYSIPSLYLHVNGKTEEYTGTPEVFEIVEWLMKKTNTTIRDWPDVPFGMKDGSYEINQHNYNRFAGESLFSMIYFYDDDCQMCKKNSGLMKKLTEAFSTNGQPSGDTVFGSFLVTDNNMNHVMDKYNLTSVPTILYHHMGQPAQVYTGSYRPMDLTVFVKGNTAGTMMQYTAELTGERFHQYLKMKPTVFVKFVSGEKDGHTWFNELNYNGIAALASDWKSPAVFAKFNVTKYPEVLGDDHVDALWALYVYKWGIRYEYNPANNMEDDVAALERLSGDLITTVDHKHDTISEPGQSETMVILGVFPKEVSEYTQTLTQWIISHDSQAEYYQTFDRRFMKRFNVTEPEIFIIYPTDCVVNTKAGGSAIRRIKFAGQTQIDIHTELYDAMHHVDKYPLICGANYRGLTFSSGTDHKFVVSIYIHLDWGHDGHSHMTYWTKRLTPLAAKYREKGFYFVFADEEMHYDIVHDYKLREGTASEILFCIFSGGFSGLPYYPTAEELDDADSVTELIEGYMTNIISGKIRPNMKSERIAVPWDHGKMNKIVGSQIYEFMEQKDKFIILILAYEYDASFIKINEFLEDKAVEYPDILFGRINIKTNNIFFNLSKRQRTQNQVIIKPRGVGSEVNMHGNMISDVVDKFDSMLVDHEYQLNEEVKMSRDEL